MVALANPNVPGLAAYRQLETAAGDMTTDRFNTLALCRSFCMTRTVRRFGFVVAGSALCIPPVENCADAATWLSGPGEPLEFIVRNDPDPKFWLWTREKGLVPMDGYDLIATLIKPPLQPNDLVRVDPFYDGNCARAVNRVGQIVRRCGPLMLVDIQDVGVVAVNPDLLHPAHTEAVDEIA